MKHEWKKAEKQLYLPSAKPQYISVPTFKFFTIEGQGNPNDDFFAHYVGVLYSLSYGVKMSLRKGIPVKGYTDYTVYPLEGIWSLSEEGIRSFNGKIDKNTLTFKLMIRQPDFVEEDFAWHVLEQTKKNKPHELLEQVSYEALADGDCIQMLHLGSYDNEPESFKQMERYAQQEGYLRTSKDHREIYLSDARKVSPDRLKTVLRFGVEKE